MAKFEVITTKHYWIGKVETTDDFGDEIDKEFIDGATRKGSWAIMTPKSWRQHGVRGFGIGRGQRYEKQPDGRWLKVEG